MNLINHLKIIWKGEREKRMQNEEKESIDSM